MGWRWQRRGGGGVGKQSVTERRWTGQGGMLAVEGNPATTKGCLRATLASGLGVGTASKRRAPSAHKAKRALLRLNPPHTCGWYECWPSTGRRMPCRPPCPAAAVHGPCTTARASCRHIFGWVEKKTTQHSTRTQESDAQPVRGLEPLSLRHMHQDVLH